MRISLNIANPTQTKSHRMNPVDKVSPAEPEAVALGPLLGRLRELIVQARTQALRAVDTIQVQTCWEIGRYIVEFEQQGQARATYGARLLPQLAERLMQEFGRGFDARNLRHMRTFYQSFPIWDAVRTELSWTHYRTLLRVESEAARQWYVREAVRQNWSSRALERQISTLYYERLLVSQDKAAVAAEVVRRTENRAGRQPHGGHYFVFAKRCFGGALFGAEWQRTAVCQPLQAGAADRGGVAARAGPGAG